VRPSLNVKDSIARQICPVGVAVQFVLNPCDEIRVVEPGCEYARLSQERRDINIRIKSVPLKFP
jgi:hypothetical protein